MVGDNTFDVTKGKSKDYYNLFIREKAKPPNIIKKLQSNFHFNSDDLRQIFKLPHSIVVESYVKAFQYKVINSILPPQDFNAKGESTRTTRFHFKTKEFILTRFSTLAILPH